jgi:hypothetical protein
MALKGGNEREKPRERADRESREKEPRESRTKEKNTQSAAAAKINAIAPHRTATATKRPSYNAVPNGKWRSRLAALTDIELITKSKRKKMHYHV